MSVLEMVVLIGFGVPIVLLCGVFVVFAAMMQAEEDCKAAYSYSHGD